MSHTLLSLNKKEYRIPMCVTYNCYKKKNLLFYYCKYVVSQPNPNLVRDTGNDCPSTSCYLDCRTPSSWPLFLHLLLSSFLLFSLALIVFSSSSFFSGETLADSHTLTLAYLPTYEAQVPSTRSRPHLYQVCMSIDLPPTLESMLPPVLHAPRQGEQTNALHTQGT